MEGMNLQLALVSAGATGLDAPEVRGIHRVSVDPYHVWGPRHQGTWLFGAMAEFADLAMCAKAKSLRFLIFKKFCKDRRSIPVLSIAHDGTGLARTGLVQLFEIGDSLRRDSYGVLGCSEGLLAATGRLGKSALILTQNDNSRSIALLSQRFCDYYNEKQKGVPAVWVPVITYTKDWDQFTEESLARTNANQMMDLVEAFSPFDQVSIGEIFGLFKEGSGTKIYIWDLETDKSVPALKWTGDDNEILDDILIRSKRKRPKSRSLKIILLDYSLRAYMEVLFANPIMAIEVGGSVVECVALARCLKKVMTYRGTVRGKEVELTLGRRQDTTECGIYFYWNGRLIEPCRVMGSLLLKLVECEGLTGVVDLTAVVDALDVHLNKQQFISNALFEDVGGWITVVIREHLKYDQGSMSSTDYYWVRCDKCFKWRDVKVTFAPVSIWDCSMAPYTKTCDVEEESPGPIHQWKQERLGLHGRPAKRHKGSTSKGTGQK